MADQSGLEDPYTERDAFADILKWSADLHNWQRDALRRLMTVGELTPACMQECAELCLDANKPCDPLTSEHVVTGAPDGEPVSLVSISRLTGINALAGDQTLELAPNGLTIVYGDNGTGKSGYVRVLKHACRTRDTERPILRDVEDVKAKAGEAELSLRAGPGRRIVFAVITRPPPPRARIPG